MVEEVFDFGAVGAAVVVGFDTSYCLSDATEELGGGLSDVAFPVFEEVAAVEEGGGVDAEFEVVGDTEEGSELAELVAFLPVFDVAAGYVGVACGHEGVFNDVLEFFDVPGRLAFAGDDFHDDVDDACDGTGVFVAGDEGLFDGPVNLGFIKGDYSSIPLLDFHFRLPSSEFS